MHEVTQEIFDYVQARVDNGNLLWPDSIQDALLFAQTELAEAIEVLMAKKSYVRNNPDDKPTWSESSFSSELGDAMFMCIVAGLMAGVDPVSSMLLKRRNDARTDKRG